jgi:hypothetical protein
MKTTHRIALIYAVSAAAAGGAAYWRGKRGMELVKDTTCYGLAGGTAANLIAFVVQPKSIAKSNGFGLFSAITNTAKMSAKGAKMLSSLDTETLYASMSRNGVKVAPVPANASMIKQES